MALSLFFIVAIVALRSGGVNLNLLPHDAGRLNGRVTLAASSSELRSAFGRIPE
jgi:hypothetical protein